MRNRYGLLEVRNRLWHRWFHSIHKRKKEEEWPNRNIIFFCRRALFPKRTCCNPFTWLFPFSYRCINCSRVKWHCTTEWIHATVVYKNASVLLYFLPCSFHTSLHWEYLLGNQHLITVSTAAASSLHSILLVIIASLLSDSLFSTTPCVSKSDESICTVRPGVAFQFNRMIRDAHRQ